MGKLIVVCGPPYAGKTTLGRKLVARFGHAAVDVDLTKERLHGPGLKDDDLTREQWRDIYARTDQQIEDHLRSGKTVVDDSRNFRKVERIGASAIAERRGAAFLTVYVATPIAVLRQRMLENRENPTRHDMTDAQFEHILSVWEAPTEDERPLVFRHGENPQEWMSFHAHELA